MTGNFNNKKESKPLSHKTLRVSGGGYKPYKINDLADCTDAQFSASLESEQDSAVLLNYSALNDDYDYNRARGRETTHKCFAHPESLQPIPRKRCCGSAAGIRLEIFKQRNENLPYRKWYFESGRKFSFLSFKISFNNALFSFFCDTFLSFIRKKERKVSKKNNKNFCFMFHPFFGAKNGWSPRNSRAAVPLTQKVTQTCARQLGLYKWLSLIKLKCLLYLHSPQTNLACSCL